MPPPLVYIRKRIRDIENIGKITRAMQLVSVSKLKRVQDILSIARPYLVKIELFVKNIASASSGIRHPLFEERMFKNSYAVCAVTSDTGLCGAHNNEIIRATEDFVARHGRDKASVISVGKEGTKHFGRAGIAVRKSYDGFGGRYSGGLEGDVTKELLNMFSSGEADEVYIAYMHFESMLRRRPVVEKFLNISQTDGDGEEYIYEPNADEILDELLPQYVRAKMRLILLEAFVAEHAARAVTMKTATDNAAELIDSLVLLKNKIRQASITKEVIEIVSSAEALKG